MDCFNNRGNIEPRRGQAMRRDCSCGVPPATILPTPPPIMPRQQGCGDRMYSNPMNQIPRPPMPRMQIPRPQTIMPITSEIDQKPIAMAYVPCQKWGQVYTFERALDRGTIFPDLDLPFVMGRCQ